MSSCLLIGPLADGLSGRGVDDMLPFIHRLPLDLQHGRVVLREPQNDIVSGLNSVVSQQSSRDTSKFRPIIPVGRPDTVDSDNPSELEPFPIPVTKFSLENQEMTNADTCLHDSQETCNLRNAPGL